ncbi:MAG: DUF3488 domain-containing transglutaminase family protein [Burkholderiales bacterium]|nr:DUF3488 domain-containing transglutaminase family protein [Burkholderiales bacterium]
MRSLLTWPLLSRDKEDTLLLLCACLLVLLPHVAHVAWWVSLICGCMLAWRAWLTLSGRRLPRAWLLIPLSALMMGGVYLSHRTLFGRDAGVTMLVLLLTCKLLEMHARRDLFVVIFLSFFLLLTNFFYHQSIGSATLTLLALGCLLSAQLSFHYTGLLPPLRQRLKQGMSILGLALPLTLATFFLFPRIQGPLWGLPGDAHAGRSGLSDSMTPGNISELVLSEDIAFRVQFAGSVPDKSKLYWRGVVLNRYDGRSWSGAAERLQADGKPLAVFSGEEIHQHIILEPQGQRWLFALDLPAAPPALEDSNESGSGLTAQMELRSAQNLHQRVRYDVVSFPQYRLQSALAPPALQAALDLPAGFNPRTQAFAAALRQKYPDDRQLIQSVLNYFRQQAFVYTLEPPALGRHSSDEFLFDTRAGFCEHYASAFVVLMRAAAIPARVVTGYQGGTLNTIDAYLEVRQSDAHAWAEVWLPGQGWLRVDPTAAVAPERVMQSLAQVLPRRGVAALVNLALGGNSWFARARMRWDAINNSWNLWVLNYNQGTQLQLLRSLGWREVDWGKLALLFFACAAAIMALIALPLVRNRAPLSALDRVYFSFCRKMEKKAPPKAVHEGPYAYAQRLQPLLPAAEFEPAQEFLLLYATAKYGKTALPPDSLIPRLKTLLAKCR